ncbi:MAG: flagellar basal body-associated FliL family protein [Clostridium sp.]|jgi:flagellar FliL protein|nr:flagellar basal body-associated FliL family protein [Clostridium sp.]
MKKNLLTVLILGLLIVNIVLTSIMVVSVVGTNGKTAALVNDISAALNLELTGPLETAGTGDVPLEDIAEYAIGGAMTIPLRSTDGKDHYILFNIAFMLNSKHEDYKTYNETELAKKENMITDRINSVVTAHTLEECKENIEGLKAEILSSIQQLLQSDVVFKVAISEVKFS